MRKPMWILGTRVEKQDYISLAKVSYVRIGMYLIEFCSTRFDAIEFIFCVKAHGFEIE